MTGALLEIRRVSKRFTRDTGIIERGIARLTGSAAGATVQQELERKRRLSRSGRTFDQIQSIAGKAAADNGVEAIISR